MACDGAARVPILFEAWPLVFAALPLATKPRQNRQLCGLKKPERFELSKNDRLLYRVTLMQILNCTVLNGCLGVCLLLLIFLLLLLQCRMRASESSFSCNVIRWQTSSIARGSTLISRHLPLSFANHGWPLWNILNTTGLILQ